MNALWLGSLGLGAADLAQLFAHFALLSLLAVGGAMGTAPDMHRWIVGRQGWLDDAQFSGSIALAKAAPGPNVLFVAVLGFNVGGLAGALAALGGSLLPSASRALAASRWGDQPNRASLTEGKNSKFWRRGLRAGHDGRQKMPVVRTPVTKTPS